MSHISPKSLHLYRKFTYFGGFWDQFGLGDGEENYLQMTKCISPK